MAIYNRNMSQTNFQTSLANQPANNAPTGRAAATVTPSRVSVDNQARALADEIIAERANKAGIQEVAFDRSGFKYHGRVKALAEAARENGLKF